ncbi:hypothetical protein BH09BAC3_BH09BAC3_22840 [soil metagenome]
MFVRFTFILRLSAVFVISAFFLALSHEANAQCVGIPVVQSIGSNKNPNSICSTVNSDLLYSVRFFTPTGPQDLRVYFFWGDGTAPDDVAIPNGQTTYTNITANHTFPANSDCEYLVQMVIFYNGLPCPSTYQTQYVQSYRTEAFNQGLVQLINPLLGTNIYEVCAGSDLTNAVFNDLTNFNCNASYTPSYPTGTALIQAPNTLDRWQSLVYDTRTTAGNRIPNLTVGGVPVTGAGGAGLFGAPNRYQDPRGVLNLAAPVVIGDGRRRNTLPMSAPGGFGPAFPQVGDRFEVTIRYWNFCNPYDDPLVAGPPADLINGDNAPIEAVAIIRVVAAPAPPTGSTANFCNGTVPTAFSISGTTGGATVRWYANVNGATPKVPGTVGALITTTVASGGGTSTLPIATAFPGFNNTVADNYIVWASYTGASGSLTCESQKVAVTRSIREALTTPPAVNSANSTFPICGGTNGVELNTGPPAPGSNTIGGAWTYEWSTVSAGITLNATTGSSITMDIAANASGAKTVTVISRYSTNDTNGANCSLSRPFNFTVNIKPVGGIVTGGSTPICVTNNTGLMTLSGHTGTIEEWQVDDGTGGGFVQIPGPITTTTFSQVLNTAGTYIYRVQLGSGVCAKAFSATRTIVVNGRPASATIAGGATICQGNSTNLTVAVGAGGLSPYTVTLSTGQVIAAYVSGANIPVSPAATTNYTITSVTDANGCPATGLAGSALVTVSNPTNSVISRTGASPICPGGSSTIAVTITGGLSPYTLKFTDGTTTTTVLNYVSGTNVAVGPLAASKTYTLLAPVGAAVVDANGCPVLAQSGSAIISVGSLPTSATFSGGSAVCLNAAKNLVLNIVGGVAPYSITVTSSTGPNIVNAAYVSGANIAVPTTVLGPTNYNVSIITDACGSPLALASIAGNPQVVTVNPLPIGAGGPSATVCSKANLNIDPSTFITNGVASTYAWTASYPAGLTGPASGTGNITGIVTNTSGSLRTGSFTITPTSTPQGCVGATYVITVPVNSEPVGASPTLPAVCSGPINLDPQALAVNVAGGNSVSSTFSWTASYPGAITGGAAAGIGNITGVLSNVSGATANAVFTVTATAVTGSCVGTNFVITLPVNSGPVLGAGQAKTICGGSAVGYRIISVPANLPVGTVYNWPDPDGAGPAAAGVNVPIGGGATIHINDILTNLTGVATTTTYVVTPSNGTCTGAPQNVVITVNPLPNLATPQATTVCSGTAIGYHILMNPVDLPAGTTLTWPDPDGAGPSTAQVAPLPIGTAATIHINDVITNVTGANITKTYAVTPVSAGCTGTTRNVVVTITPAPNLVTPQSKTICSGANASYEILLNPVNQPVGTVFNWPDPDAAGPATGGTDVPMGVAGTKHINDVLTNFTGAPVTITYVITPSIGPAGCAGTPRNVVITVNPLPVPNPINGPGTVCVNPTTTLLYQVTPNAGSTYNWVVPAPFIKFAGGTSADFFVLVRFPAVGTGNITMTETNSFGCVGAINTLSVTAASAPGALSITGPDPVCKSQIGVNYSVPPASFNPTSTYNWTASGATIVSAASGVGLQTITVDFGLSAAATINVSEVSVSGCSGTPFTKNVTVGDRPSMTSLNTTTICSGDAPTLVFTSTLPSTFTWKVTSIIGSITGASVAQAGAGDLSATFTGGAALRNTSGAVGSVLFDVTPTGTAAPNCVGVVQSVSILVNPEPVLISPQTKTICSGQSVSYEILLSPANLPSGTTFTWAAPVMSAGGPQGTAQSNIPMGVAGTKHILDVLTNTSGATITATYTIVPTSGAGCSSTQAVGQRQVVITVNPQPVMTAVSDITVCPGQAIGPINFSANTLGGETFSWTNDNALVGIGTSGTGNILAVSAPANSTGSNIVGNFSVTATKNGCVSSAVTFKVTVKPQPVVSAITDISVCPGATVGPINFVANSGGGETFNWTNTNPAVGAAISGIGNIASYVAPPNLTGVAFVGDFSVTATKNGCTSTPVTFKITIKPEPVITPISNISVCPTATIGPINFAANTGGGETFSWTNDNTAVGLAAAGVGNIASYAAPANLSGNAFVANISVSTLKNGCPSAAVTFTITVKPQPVVTAVTDITVCPGATIGPINFAANSGGGETFNWTNDNAAVGAAVSGSGNIASYVAPTNVSGSAFIGNFSVTATKNGCTSAPITFKITVKPTPVVNTVTSASVCPGAAVGPFNFTANTGGSEAFAWTNDNTLVGLAGSGVGNIASFTASPNLTGANLVANISVTATKNSCPSAPFIFQVTVKPQPVVTPITDIAVCPGQTIGPLNFVANTAGGETFSWTNDNTTIGLVGSGTGSIASWIAPSNLTGANFVGNISVTATKNSCTSTAMIFKITIVPQPVVTALPDIAKCPGTSVGPVNFVANTGGGETFNWTNTNAAIGLGVSGIGNIPTYTAPVNLTGSPLVGTISVTAVKNGCTSVARTFTITISPTPVMNPVASISLCPGATVGPINFGANTGGGETFSWTNSNAAIGIGTSGTGNIASYLAPVNLTGSDIQGTINVTATLNGCLSAASTFTITIKPSPVVSAVSNITRCPTGIIGPIAFTANTGGGETFNWTNTNVAIGLVASGTGTIASYAAPANTTGVAFVGTISVTATKNGCTSSPVTFQIIVDPQPIVNVVSNVVVCPGQTVAAINFGANTGGGETFSWANSNTTVGLAASGSGNIASYTAPANLTGAAFVSTVTVTATRNTCVSPNRTFTITVNPQPVVTAIANVSVCPTAVIGPFNFASNSGGGETYSWTNSNPSIGLVASGTGNIPSWAAPANLTGTAFVGTISVIGTKNGCSSTAMTYTVTVKPQPVVSSESNIIVCPGESVGPINFAANTGGAETFNWTNSNTLIGLVAAGTGDIGSYLAPANLTGANRVGTISVTATKNGCLSTAMVFTITVKPQPVVNAVADISVCPGATIGPINFGANTGGGEVFDWNNSNTAIGLVSSGSGNIAAFAAPANVTGAAFVSNMTVTATKNGCISGVLAFTITVKPQPIVAAVADISVCPTQPVGPIAFTANTGGGETFNWTNTNIAVGLAAGGAGNIASYAAPANLTGADFVATVSVTATKTLCASPVRTFQIVVKAQPVVAVIPNVLVCTGATIGPLNFTANTAGGETFNWTNTNASIGLPLSGTGNIASYTSPSNTTNANFVGTISVTAVKGGCTSVVRTFTITVQPKPVVSSSLNITRCSSQPYGLNLNTDGVSIGASNYNVAAVVQAGLTGLPTTGLARPANAIFNDAFANKTATPLTVTYTITPNGTNGCIGDAKVIVFTINPEPVLFNPGQPAICSNEITNVILGTDGISVSAASYQITGKLYSTDGGATFLAPVPANFVDAGNIALNTPGNSFLIRNDKFTNTRATQVIVRYSVVATGPAASGACNSAPVNFDVPVNPQPTFDPALNPTPVCSGVISSVTLGVAPGSVGATTYNINSITFTGLTAGASNTGIGTGKLANAIFNDVYINTTNGPIPAVYKIVPVSAAGCLGPEATLTLTINASPEVEDNLGQTVCSDAVGGITLATKGSSTPASNYNIISVTIQAGLIANAGNVAIPASAVAPGYLATDRFDNPTNAVLTVTYRVEPRSGLNCLGPQKDIVLKIEPTIKATPINNKPNICSTSGNGADPTDILFVSPTVPTAGVITFSYTAVSSIGAQMSGFVPALSNLAAGYRITDNLVNNSNAPAFVTYTITPIANGARGGAGCNGTPVPVVVNVEPKPKLVAAPTIRTVCEGVATNISLTSLTTPSVGTVEYLLVSAVATGGVTGASANGTVFAKTSTLNDILSNPGISQETVTYTLRPRINGGAGCIGDDVTVTISVNPRPSVTATPQAPVCSGVDPVNITLTYDVPLTIGTWTVSAPATIVGASPGAGDNIFQILFNNGNVVETVNYTVTPIANGCGGTPLVVSVQVNPRAKVLGTPLTKVVCHGASLNIPLSSNVAAGVTYAWVVDDPNGLGAPGSFDGSGSTIVQPLTNTLGFQASLTYTITPTGPGGCIGESKIMIVTVSPEISAAFLNPVPDAVCKGSFEYLIFQFGGQPLFNFTYTDGTTSFPVTNKGNVAVIQKTMNATTTFTITSVTDGLGCTAPFNVPLTVKVGDTDPTFTIISPVATCTPNTVSFQYNESTGTRYTWRFGDVADSTEYLGTTNGLRVIKHIYSNLSPTTTLNYPVTLQTKLDDPDFGPVGGCPKNSTPKTVTIYPKIIVNILSDKTEICSGESIQFLNQSVGATSQAWTFRTQGQVTETALSNAVNFNSVFTNTSATNPIIYEVIYRGTNANCPAPDAIIPITVYRSVVASFDDGPTPHLFVNGESLVTFTNTSIPVDGTIYNYDWSFGTDAQLPAFSGPNPPTTRYVSPGPKTITLVASNKINAACKSTFTKTINVDLPPLIATFLASPLESCFPSDIEIVSANITGNIIVWKVIDQNGRVVANSSAALPIFQIPQAGKFTITLTASNSVTAQTVTATPQDVVIYPKPRASFLARPEVVFVPDTEMTTTNFSTGANQYYWDFDFNGDNSTLEEPKYTYKIEGVYNLALYAQFDHGNNLVCADTLIQKITAKQGGITKVPNAFTPNLGGPGANNGAGDQSNDVFLPLVKGAEEYNLQIYDRWGNLIFESNSTQVGWDGYSADGKLLPAGVYVYKLTIRLSDGQRSTQIGDVTMIR